MRTSFAILSLAALVALSGCVVKTSDEAAAGASGSSGSAGAAGQAGAAGEAGAAGAAAGAAGSGGSIQAGAAGAGDCRTADSVADICGTVPATGVCQGNSISLCVIPDSPCDPPRVVTKECPAGWTCQQTDDGASCKNPGECIAGDTRCKDEITLESCIAGVWTPALCPNGSACLVSGGAAAQCDLGPSAQAGKTYPLKGNIQYEYHLPNATYTGMGDVQTDGAFFMLMAAWTNDEFVGSTISDGEGNFQIDMTLPPSDKTRVFAFPMSFTYDGTRPLSAVTRIRGGSVAEKQASAEDDTSEEYWRFEYHTAPISAATTELSPWTVTEGEGSGAIWVFQWMEFAFKRMHDMYPDRPQMTAVTFWDPGVGFDCGACFYPPGLGAPRVSLGDGSYDYYDTRFSFTGTAETPKHWQRSSISHEFGHYVMSNYSQSPLEGGPHGLNDESKPGLAYSEGWATFFGQRNMSSPDDGIVENIYSSVASGTYWWFDLDEVATDGDIPKADPNGALDQNISEAIVTSMLWNLWAPPASGLPRQNLGDKPLFDSLTSGRTTSTSLNRGYKRVDYVDYADGFACTFPDNASRIDAISLTVGHPYKSSAKLCQ